MADSSASLWLKTAFIIIISLLASTGSAAAATGDTPENPLIFPEGTSSLSLEFTRAEDRWVRVPFSPSSNVSHLALTADDPTRDLSVYVDLKSAQNDDPLAENRGSTSTPAELDVALGFSSPFLIKIRSAGSGTATVTRRAFRKDAERCDWPAGCPLAAASEGKTSAVEVLSTLRRVRSDLLKDSDRGRELIELYWRMAPWLLKELALDTDFRAWAYGEVESLLPLAHDALAAQAGTGGRAHLTTRDVEGMAGLVSELVERVPASVGAELEQAWQRFALGLEIGRPLAEILESTGLLSSTEPTVLLVKFRSEPRIEDLLGQKRGRGSSVKTGAVDLDELLSEANPTAVRRLHRSTSAHKSAHQAAGLSRTVIFEISDRGEARILLERLQDHPGVEWTQLSARVRLHNTDPFRDDLWGIDAVRAPSAWPTTQGACTTRVAIIDTGMRRDVADLSDRLLWGLGYNTLDDNTDATDGHGHGTHVGGTVAATGFNSISVIGVAPQACLIPVKVIDDSGSGSVESVAAGIVHAADVGADVINMSLGFEGETQEAIEDAMAYAVSKDVVIVVSAGNDSAEGGQYPASSELVLAIGALDEDLSLASFSNYGPDVDLVAPGVDVVSTFINGESCTGSGTSMASPHAAGVAALVRSANPSLNRQGVIDVLMSTAIDLGDPGRDDTFGEGLVNADAAVRAAAGAGAGGGGGGGGGPSSCGAGCLAFHQGRFEARIDWRAADGTRGSGGVVPVGSSDSRLAWFFDPGNWEMLIKVLDGCAVNGNFWVFAAATTDVEYTLEVKDTLTGQTASYFNPLGTAAAGIADSAALPVCGSSASTGSGGSKEVDALSSSSAGTIGEVVETRSSATQDHLKTCTGNTLCLRNDRFRVEAEWRNGAGQTGSAQAVPVGSADSGMLWFFQENNWEVLVKVLDGCAINNRHWVFAAATTDVEYTLRVIDTQTGETVSYFNPLGNVAAAIADTEAFGGCG